MNNIYIKSIYIKELRHLKDINIILISQKINFFKQITNCVQKKRRKISISDNTT